ncbi:phosphatidylglycerol lysyltransferase domain-containing protein [Rhizobium sp. AAP43]|uniref:phosphatidylglycerol lysyltransferase domain-containing protein n=1 Tax=Rhizobium sp. AAP43 TaxID=1523420 RepID=UPI0006B91382|nr:phosphatidylglycerol lysyltransferase domain-containing protein [Rhizobium sp. AAP43]KPF46871.1 hypothetical protein IP76_03090 [Rhizobium sp. AAP43]
MASTVSDVESALSSAAPQTSVAPAVPRGKAVSVILASVLFRLALRMPRLALGLGAIAGCVIVTVVALGDSALKVSLGLALARYGIDAVEGTLGLSMLVGLVASRGLIRLPRRRKDGMGEGDLEKACEILSGQPNASAGLVRLGDKRLLFSECGEGFVMYARQGRSLVALFDPVAPKRLWPELAMKFVDEARRLKCRPVFYQVSPDFLPTAIDLRLQALKLGEQAVIDLSRFTLAGGDWVKLRRSINRAERDGLAFEWLEQDAVSGVMDELETVSNTWLSAHQSAEKGFSLGVFDRDYVAAGPVAVIRLEGRIVAFASVMTASNAGDAFIDLMRHVPGVHRGMMDLLFVRIIETLKARGLATLNLGMAPLAGLSDHQRAPVWNHLGRQIFEHGEEFYNFRGVRAFKEKFDPDWQPRYLAVAGQGFPVVSLLDVTLLIGGGIKGLLKK